MSHLIEFRGPEQTLVLSFLRIEASEAPPVRTVIQSVGSLSRSKVKTVQFRDPLTQPGPELASKDVRLSWPPHLKTKFLTIAYCSNTGVSQVGHLGSWLVMLLS